MVAEPMQRTGEQPVDLSVKEQNLLSTCSLARHHQRGARRETKGKTAECACVAYAEATETSGKDLVEIHPIRLGMALNIPVTAQRQIPIDRTVPKTIETSQLQCIDRVVDGPVVHVEHVPQAHVAEKLTVGYCRENR